MKNNIFKTRINTVKEKLFKNNIDIMLVTGTESKFYLSGFKSTAYFLLLTKEKDYLITDFRYLTAAKDLEDVFSLERISYDRSINDILMPFTNQKIGLEVTKMNVEEYMGVKEIFKDNIVLTKDFITKIRSVKDKEEIENLKKAEAIGDQAFEYILTELKVGVTEIEIANKLEFFMKSKGASKLSFDSIVAFGVNSTKNHAIPSDRKLEDGDFALMDFGCVYNDYCSDMTRTVGIGNISDKQREIYAIVKKAQQKAVDEIKAGLICKNFDAIARDIITNEGYGEFYGHGLGHGVGLEIHEEPYMNPMSESILLDNQVVTIEPGIYIPNEFGVRIEDLIVVKKDGHINLTSSPKELIVV